MFYTLIIGAVIFFIAHVVLLLLSFSKSALISKRYFYSHLTLWITGVLVFSLALLYQGTGRSAFLDYFDNTTKKTMILVFTLGLSLVAHILVTRLILPAMRKTTDLVNYLSNLPVMLMSAIQ
jgi:hypothetical protein